MRPRLRQEEDLPGLMRDGLGVVTKATSYQGDPQAVAQTIQTLSA